MAVFEMASGPDLKAAEVKHEPCTAVAKNILPSWLVRQELQHGVSLVTC